MMLGELPMEKRDKVSMNFTQRSGVTKGEHDRQVIIGNSGYSRR